jgi:hypothetical protein
VPRVPRDDRFPPDLEFPVDWAKIPIPPEQDPSPFHDFESTKDLPYIYGEDVRRNPDAEWVIVGRIPERPY